MVLQMIYIYICIFTSKTGLLNSIFFCIMEQTEKNLKKYAIKPYPCSLAFTEQQNKAVKTKPGVHGSIKEDWEDQLWK